MTLLIDGVPGQLNRFHAVTKRTGNRVEHVGGSDEHHIREVERDVKVMVTESVILSRVEHFEHG